jgi:transcriptional regulator with XRE-family HTH domain
MPITPAGDTIRSARKEKGWSVEKLAVEAGVSYKTIWAIENDSPAQESTLKVVAAALGLSFAKVTAPEKAAS